MCSPLPLNRVGRYSGKIPEDHTAPGIRFELFSGLDYTALGDGRLPQRHFFLPFKDRNRLMHALNGNIVLRLLDHIPDHRRIIRLEQHLPVEPEHTANSPAVYSRSFLLQCRCSQKGSEGLPVTASITTPVSTPPFALPPTKPNQSRTGRRHKFRNKHGYVCFTKKHRPHPKGSVIKESKNSQPRRKPPPRGAPGPPRGDEEFYPTQVRTTAPTGRPARAQRRRAYRRWIRGSAKERVKEPGPPYPVPPQPKQAGRTRAQWFKQTIHWQDQMKRNRKRKSVNYPTTPPLPYGNKLMVGSLNVQGFADTLKLKNAIQIMEEHHLDVLMLSETRTTT